MSRHFKKYLIFIFLFACTMLALLSSIVFAVEPAADAIAIRVIPNFEHYSSARWYNEQGYVRQPTPMVIDGYDAVRDGNTIYVNAANVIINSDGGKEFYTNIYVIAFSIGSEDVTADIFLEILSNIKFNTDLEPYEILGQCTDGATTCTLDSDCPQSYYCDSEKAKIIRDTKRLADLTEIEIALEKYKEAHGGRSPELLSGTYIPGVTVSTWPSWQQTFAPMLGLASLPTDPINKLVCGYIVDDGGNVIEREEETCWAEEVQQFVDKDPRSPKINLVPGSSVYMFVAE